MQKLLRRVARPFVRLVLPETTSYQGTLIPAKRLRFSGANFASDEDFVESGEREARRLVDQFGLTNESAVLEIGCGTGRLPIGILRTVGGIARYEGVDVSEAAIEWCSRYITPHHPTFRFTLINMKNERYNREGAETGVHLPFADRSFSIIYLYSVFSHMNVADVESYLAEFARVLKPDGKIFLTTFIEDNVPDFTENPEEYGRAWKGALHCTRFSRSFFCQLCEKHGFRIEKIDHGTETDGQSGVTLLT